MNDKLELWIAWRHLSKRRGERFISLITWLSVGGVALGVASLIAVFSVLTGYKETLRDKIVGVNAHVTAFPERQGSDIGAALRTIASVKGVTDASPFVMGQAMISSGKAAKGAALRGEDAGHRGFKEVMSKFMREGSLDKLLPGASGILIGNELAAELHVKTGDAVRVTVPFGSTPRQTSCRVVGIFSSGMFEFDSKMAIMEFGDVQRLFGMGMNVTGIGIRVDDIYETGRYAEEIGKALGPAFTVADWKKLNHNMFYALELQRVVLTLIMGLVVLVAAFNVAAALIMMVLEKTREIGILKAMGASSKTIARIFAIEGLLVGVSGAVAGTVTGLGACFAQKRYGLISIPSDVYLFDKLPVKVDPLVSAAFALGAVALCWLASSYPSWRAARLDPVEAIRTE